MKIDMKQISLLGLGFLASTVIVLISCQKEESNKAQETINKAITVHGADLFEKKKVAFTFRNKQYSSERKGADYIYTRSFEDSLGYVEDKLINSTEFTRTIDNQNIELNSEWKGKYGNSVNSVLYFVEVLYRLNDQAVNKAYGGQISIKGQPYHVIEVTFGETNGGEDFQDEYRFWIHAEDFTLDYLAYNYETEGGGVRFREAFGREKIQGITFQNYINFKPSSKDTPLDELPDLFEKGALKELSKIINEDIKVWNPV